VIPNPVELSSFRRPHSFDRSAFRAEWGFCEDDKVIVFVALGHYERKGLPLLFEALAAERGKKWKLLVVGGTPSLVNSYIQKAQSLGLAQSIRLVGHQHDVRPFLWASDLFALPSFYEVFPLGVLQASAAGCPLLITPMNGADEFLADGVSCLKIEPRVTSIIAGLRRYESLSLSERTKLAEVASGAVQIYGVDKFVSAWRDFYRSVGRECSRG
jgi:glycosyltransferase involved in cell wall biosynthesis